MKANKIICRFSILVIILSLFSCTQGPSIYEKPENFKAGIIGSYGNTNYSRLVFSWNSVPGASEYTLYKLSGDNASVYENAGSKTYVIKKTYTSNDFDKYYAVQGSNNDKPSFMNKRIVNKNLYFGEIKAYSKTDVIEWTKYPVGNNYLIVSANDTKTVDYLSPSANGYLCPDTKCSISNLSIDAAKYYAVYVYVNDAERYLRMTNWYKGKAILSAASPDGTIPDANVSEDYLDFDKYTLGFVPYFHLTWTPVQNATKYKVYAAVVMSSESSAVLTDAQLTSSNKWQPAGQSSSTNYDIYFSNNNTLQSKWQQLPNNDSCTVYFKVEPYNGNEKISGVTGKVCNFEIPKQAYDYSCTYTIRDVPVDGVKLKVIRTGSHTYKLIWDNTTSYYVLAYRDGGSTYTYWTSAKSSGTTVSASSNNQASSKYEFILCTASNSTSTKVSNKVLCEFE